MCQTLDPEKRHRRGVLFAALVAASQRTEKRGARFFVYGYDKPEFQDFVDDLYHLLYEE